MFDSSEVGSKVFVRWFPVRAAAALKECSPRQAPGFAVSAAPSNIDRSLIHHGSPRRISHRSWSVVSLAINPTSEWQTNS